MSCERHCEECQREDGYRWSYDEMKRLRSLPPATRSKRKFAFLPIRDPKSRQIFWLRKVIIFEETRVGFPSLYINTPGRYWEMVEVI